MKKIFNIMAVIAILAGGFATADSAMARALFGESSTQTVDDVCGTYTHEPNTSASCDALKTAAETLGGTCTLSLTKVESPYGACNGTGICACLWPSLSGVDL